MINIEREAEDSKAVIEGEQYGHYSENSADRKEIIRKETNPLPTSDFSIKIGKAKKINLMADEEILWKEKADVIYVSPNLLIKIIVKIKYMLGWLMGNRHKGDIICNNKRIMYEAKSYFLWIFNYKSKYQTIYLNKLSGIDIGYEASFLIFFKSKVMTVYSSGMTAPTFVFKRISEADLFNNVAKITDFSLSPVS